VIRGEASAVLRPRAMDTVSVCEEERQELLRPCRQRDTSGTESTCPVVIDVRPDGTAATPHSMAPFSSEAYVQPTTWQYIGISGSHAERIAPRKAGFQKAARVAEDVRRRHVVAKFAGIRATTG